jgi:ribosomal protein S6
MNESTSESKVYEISYLLVPSIPSEKVGAEVATFNAILEKNSAAILADESPSLTVLAYEMDKSTGGGSHQRFNEGYFGWVKFSCSPSVIEDIRKAFDQNPNILRTLAISTVKEKTYLGKRAKSDARPEERAAITAPDAPLPHDAAVKAPLSAAEMTAVDKQLDEIVKGA